ncbi:MAG: Trans-aconitate 2-methyltransferase [Chlamydiae bacterium]|nr:Trans-aconitate 2-methyltransferase [Chlamydiota bacterium]
MKRTFFILSLFLNITLFSLEHSSSQLEAAGDLLTHVTLEEGARILDVGCGDGKFTAALAKGLLDGKLLGVDISQSMISFAQKNFPTEKYPNLAFQIMDAQSLEFGEKFDWVLSFTALQWVSDHGAFLRGANLALRDRGKLLVSFPMGLPKGLQRAIDEVSMKGRWKRYFRDFFSGWNFSSLKKFEVLLAKNLFVIEYLEVVDQKDVFPSQKVFQNFFREWFPHLGPIPTDLREQFMKEVVDRYVELEPLDANQCLHFNVKRLQIVAGKDGNP